MNAIVLITFSIFTLIAYYYGKKDLISPWFLLCLALTASMLIVVINTKNWGVHLSGKFLMYTVSAIVSWGVGSALIRRVYSTQPKGRKSNKPIAESTSISVHAIAYPVNTMALVSLAAGVVYVARVISSVPWDGDVAGILRRIYDNTVYNNYSPGFIFNQMREIVVAIAYISIYEMLKIRHIREKARLTVLKLCVPVIMLGCIIAVSTDRNIFLRFAIYVIVISILFLEKDENYSNIKLIGYVVAVMLAVFVVFFLLGKAKQYASNFTRALGIYGGSGLYDFNVWIQDFNGPFQHGASTFKTTLSALQSIVERLNGGIVQAGVNRFDEFVTYRAPNGYFFKSNIYSALRPYVEDFGYAGVIIFPFISGVLFEFLYRVAKRRKGGYAWIFFAMQIYPIVFYPVLEQLFRRWHLGIIYEIGLSAIIYCICYRRKEIAAKIKYHGKNTRERGEG